MLAATKTILHKRNDTMNQHIPTQRPPQRSPQRQPQRQPQKPSSHKYGTAFIAILVSTVALLVISLIALCVALAVGSFGDDLPAADNPKGGNETKEPTQQTAPSTPTVKAKFLTFPSTKTSGNYGSTSAANADVSADTNIKSAAAILVDVSAGKSVADKNADTRIYPASMTKVMTVLVTCENAKSFTDKLTVTQAHMTKLTANKDASVWGGLAVGSTLTVEDALFLVNYQSDSVACWLLADYIAGSEDAFVQMMNARARELGCNGTNFVNNTGLHHDNHYTTCRDMATIMTAAMDNPAAKIVLTSFNGYTVNGVGGPLYASWYSDKNRFNDNPSVGGGSNMTVIGGKTGYETIPTSCFVTVAKNNSTGKTYVCVVVGRSDSTQAAITNAVSTSDTKYLYQKYAAAQ